MITTQMSIERNSNSWHLYIWCIKSRLVEDNEEIVECYIKTERDVPIGGLEVEIDAFGADGLVPVEGMQFHLNSWPKKEAVPAIVEG